MDDGFVESKTAKHSRLSNVLYWRTVKAERHRLKTARQKVRAAMLQKAREANAKPKPTIYKSSKKDRRGEGGVKHRT